MADPTRFLPAGRAFKYCAAWLDSLPIVQAVE